MAKVAPVQHKKVKKSIAFQDILSLPLDKRAAIDTHILGNGSPTELVRMIQQKWELLTDKDPNTLRRMLYRYKEELIEPKQVALVAKFADNDTLTRVAEKVEELGIRFLPIQEMEKLIHTQMHRVAKMAELEKNSPTLLDAQTKNILNLHYMLKDLASLHMDVGMLKKVPMEVEHKLSAAEQQQASKVQGFDQERQATLLALEFLRGEGVLGPDENVAEGEFTEEMRG
jgi:hypothetical protein